MAKRVAYLGPDKTTNGFLAASKHFDKVTDVEFIPLGTHPEICEAVARQEVECGVIAIENSMDGFVAESVRAVRQADGHGGVRIQAEVVLPIELFYMGSSPQDVSPQIVRSHPKALAQCEKFVRMLRTKGIVVEECASTSLAARMARDDSNVAAIANVVSEREYGLQRLVPGSVVNGGRAWTRFWVLGKHHAARTGNDKTAFLFSLERDKPANLWEAIGCFVATKDDSGVYRLNPPERRPLLLVQYSVPIPGRPFEYNFLVEFAGHVDDAAISDGISQFEASSLSLMEPHLLGSYPNLSQDISRES